MDSTVVYRVSFTGTDLTQAARSALTAAAAEWEGTVCEPQRPARHRALIKADTEQSAIAAIQGVLHGHGSFAEFDASPVTDSRGELWRGSLSCSWDEIDWRAHADSAALSELEREVLGCLADAAEPTWLVLSALAEPIDRRAVESVLEGLDRQGLVYSTLEQSGEPCRESKLDRWWAITDECWDMLGLIKSPMYG
jgi:hypothetical protein